MTKGSTAAPSRRPHDHYADGNPALDAIAAARDEILAAVLAYLELGWFVFPLCPPTWFGPQGGGIDRAGCWCDGVSSSSKAAMCTQQGKHGIGPWHLRHHGLDPFLPSLSRLTGGIKGATNNVKLAKRWWGDHLPGAPIGVDLRRSGLIVVDVDSPAAQIRLKEFTDRYSRLDAWIALTARGAHYWMTMPEGASPISAPKPLEFKFNQATAPPSFHCTGVRYAWIQRG